MDAPTGFRLAAWTAFAALLGVGLGFFLGSLWDAWTRLSTGAYTRSTLFHVLGLLFMALLAFLLSTAARTVALQPRPPRRRPGEALIRGSHPTGR